MKVFLTTMYRIQKIWNEVVLITLNIGTLSSVGTQNDVNKLNIISKGPKRSLKNIPYNQNGTLKLGT